MNETIKRKRRMLLVMPLLVIPFLTMAFWALGGGQGAPEIAAENQEGLQTRLPEGKAEEPLSDKLSFYEKAKKDSIKLAEWLKSDPNYQPGTYMEPAEDRILEKVGYIREQLNQKEPIYSPAPASPEFTSQVNRLESMMQVMQRKTGDPEIRGLEGVLDKILDIQHPERVKLSKPEEPSASSPMVQVERGPRIGLLGAPVEDRAHSPGGNAVYAAVHGDQELVSGSVIKLRLLDNVSVSGHHIPAGNFIYGYCSLGGERLQVEIPSLRHQNSVYPVQLQVYDLDGLPGIHIPGSLSREVAREAAGHGLEQLGTTTLDASLKAQATVAGIGAVKNLFTKKTKLVRVTVKSGYRVLLQIKNS